MRATRHLQATADGGTNWFLLDNDFGDNSRILDFFAHSPANMWLILEQDTLIESAKLDNKTYHVYHSGDSALSWEKVYTSPDTYLRGIFFINDSSGWIYGSNYKIMKTGDGGNSWNIQYSDTLTGFIKDCYFLNDSTGYAVGDHSLILKTSDQGASWNLIGELPAYSSLNTVFALDEDNIWTGGSPGRIFFSKDGGNSWKLKQLAIGEEVFDLYFKNELTGWAAAAAGKLYYTTTGDTLWDTTEFSTENLRALFFLDEDHGWIAGSQGLILKTNDGGGEVSIGETSEMKLLRAPYPNPVSSRIYIDLSGIKGSDISLEIIDLNGKALKKQKVSSSIRHIGMDVSILPDGIYFLRVKNLTQLSVFKIIKI
ncbi:MAG: YCF48-related protein [Bacteroidota bacterium]|nr:YCF48-related protein [Bacteroidota bacterium]